MIFAGGRFKAMGGLGLRLMATMGIALLPLALLTYVQTVQTERVAESRARAAILGETLMAAGPQIDVVMRARGAASSLAALMPALSANLNTCKAALREVAESSEGTYSLVTYMKVNGKIDCSSTGESYDFSDSPFLQSWLSDPRPAVDVNPKAPISNTSILIFSHPVRDSDGTLTGFVTVSSPHAVIDRVVLQSGGDRAMAEQPLSLVTFDAKGEVLTSSLGLAKVSGVLPISHALGSFVGLSGHSFLDTTSATGERAFAVVPLVPGALYLLGSWPANRLDDTLIDGDLPPVTFPLLMWAASLLVAWLAAESQVLRHVRSLRDSITAFAGGNRTIRPLNLNGAATEFREVGEAYEKMTDAVLHDEADLENTLHQKEVLLREVHHRVKNNLQLIASILNMQLRTARSAETKEAMRSVQDRVLSLATVHRELYQTSGLTDVRADELLPQIVGHILKMGTAPGRRFDMEMDIDPIRLTPDQAVPLALFLSEGMANVLKHAWQGSGEKLRVGLKLKLNDAGEAAFSLCNSIQKPTDRTEEPVMEGGFGNQLLEAFSRQLDGRLEQVRTGDAFSLTLQFPLRPLSDAEEREAAKAGGGMASDES